MFRAILKRMLCGAGVAAVLMTLTAAVGAAPAQAPQDTSSPAQVDGIVGAVVDRLWAKNDEYWHRGDYPRIIALDRIITQADPHFVECYNTGAWLMWSSGRDADAQAFYAQAVAHNPHDPAAYYDYGMFLFNHRKDYPAAVRVYRRDTQRANGGLLDWRMLAHSYEKAGDWARAVQTWRQIKARWPHGTDRDPASAAVDARNLQRALAHLNGPAAPQIRSQAGEATGP